MSVYGWFSSLGSSVETPAGTLETNLSFGDLLNNLDSAAFAALEAQNDDWSFIADLNYTDLDSSKDTPFGLAYSEGTVDVRMTILGGYAGYAVVNQGDTRLDILGGLRYYSLDLDTRLVGVGPVSDVTLSASESWVDPVIGLRYRTSLNDGWFVNGVLDFGGFGIGDASDLSWQGLAGVGYRFNERWSMQGGYRHLSIDKSLNSGDSTLDLSGPFLGVTATF